MATKASLWSLPDEPHRPKNSVALLLDFILCCWASYKCFWRGVEVGSIPPPGCACTCTGDRTTSNLTAHGPVIVVAALNTQGRSWTLASPIRSISGQWNLSFLPVLPSNKFKSPQFGISKIYRVLATCWYLSGVCVLSSCQAWVLLQYWWILKRGSEIQVCMSIGWYIGLPR